MPSESDLRERLRAGTAPDDGIDVDAVLRRSRARRRPRVVATVALSSLAAVGIVVPISIGFAGQFSIGGASSASAPDLGSPEKDAGIAPGEPTPGAASGSSSGSVSERAPAEKINLCTGTVADVAPAANGLVLTVAPVRAAATDRDIPASVTLTNTGTSTFRGSASPFPALTLSRDGIVLWHSNGPVPSLAQAIDLAPGAAVTFSTSFEPLTCGIADDEQSSFRSDLPEAGPGDYQLSAALDVISTDGEGVLVTGPSSAVTLR